MKKHLGDLRIDSSAFEPLGYIPKRYTPAGENISPPLAWINTPTDTKEFALICHDPDAPYTYGYTHWVLYGIPPEVTSIDEGQGKSVFTWGINSSGESGYTGPDPPQGHGPHHYYFLLYALDKALDLKPGLTRNELLNAIDEHITVQARYIGIYEF
jgi:Raf kinase inhibitor-like YbhB/YbcL family protein